MAITSKAVIRFSYLNLDGMPGEDRYFKRPDGGYSRASYVDDDAPDDQPDGEVFVIPAEDADVVIQLMTGKSPE
jgi:hypothetical protein